MARLRIKANRRKIKDERNGKRRIGRKENRSRFD